MAIQVYLSELERGQIDRQTDSKTEFIDALQLCSSGRGLFKIEFRPDAGF